MTSADLKRLRTYLEKNKTRHIERIQRVVQQPSVSTENLGVRECAELLVKYHRELGCHEAALLETDGLPGLWAYYDAGAPKTIAVYGNFDTRPVLPHEQWEHPPYSAALASFGPYPRVLVGRGSFAYKGPYVAWLNALEALVAVTGTLPVNVMTLLEGDEILGSPNFRDMYAQYRDRLVTADASLSPGASQDASGRVNLSLGYKGMICSELIASGARWGRGPLGQPLHGMTKSVVDSPVWKLTHALSTLTAADGNRVTVKGFYEDLTPPTEEERRAVQSYWDAMGGGPWNKVLPGLAAARVPVGDLGDEETVLNYFYAPSFNINGLRAGFTGPGTLPFSLPHEALASFDIRLPRGYSAEKVIRLLRRTPGWPGLRGCGAARPRGLRPLRRRHRVASGSLHPPRLQGDGSPNGCRSVQRRWGPVVLVCQRPGPYDDPLGGTRLGRECGRPQRILRRRRHGERGRPRRMRAFPHPNA